MEVSPWTGNEEDLLVDSDLDSGIFTFNDGSASTSLSGGGHGLGSLTVGSSVIPEGVDLSKFQSWSQRNFWSQQNKIWGEYVVEKPRLPNEDDGKERWHEKYYPLSLDDFFEVPTNDKALNELNKMLETRRMRNLIVQGPSSSGKTAAIIVCLREHFGALGYNVYKDPTLRSVLLVFSEHESKTLRFAEIEMRIRAFSAKKVKSTPVKAVLFEGVCKMPPKVQQNVRKMMDDFDAKLKFFITCFEPKKLVANIKQRAQILKMHRITEEQAIRFILYICMSEDIGFEREGLEEIYKKFEPDIKAVLDGMQKVFIKHHYISYVNACKEVSTEKLEGLRKATVTDIDVLRPISRCEKCTLPLPCQHHPRTELQAKADQRRKELPQRPGGMYCQTFLKDGSCVLFNREGHCSLHHPMDQHIITHPIERCRRCTLPMPCQHCRYFKEQEKLQSFITSSRKNIHARKKILDEEEFTDLMKKIDQIARWLKNSGSIEEKEYIDKSNWLKKYINDVMARFPLVPDSATVHTHSTSFK